MTSIPMTSVFRRAIPVLLASALAWATPAAAAQDPGAPGRPSGTISLQAKAAAVGVGFTWGDGILTFHGHRYPFEVKGITIVDVGFSRLSGRGRVYNLKKVEDFSGIYAASTGEATLGRGLAGQVLVNSAGVQLRIDNVTRGARLSGSADGIQLTLK